MNLAQKEKTHRMEVRFKTKKQRNELKKFSKKHGRSMNAELLVALDMYLYGQYAKKELITTPAQ